MEQKSRTPALAWVGKALLAGVIALIALTLFCMLYDNTAIHHTCADGATDDKWEAGSFYSIYTEGFGWGRYNNDGYRNGFDYAEGTAVDILMLGSSHLEGNAMTIDKVMSTILGNMLPGKLVYNIGMDGHSLFRCAGNMQAAVQKYRPKSYVIFETHSLQFPDADLEKVLAGTYPERSSYSDGIIGLLQRNQFLRRIYHQLANYIDENAADQDTTVQVQSQAMNDPALLSAVLSRMSETVASAGAKLVIAYHPATALQSNGSIQFPTSEAEEDAFAALCEENGIYFLDMRDRFLKEYEENHILPYGFTNTSVGSGHLNRYGHQMMAEELYALMQEVGL